MPFPKFSNNLKLINGHLARYGGDERNDERKNKNKNLHKSNSHTKACIMVTTSKNVIIC